MVSVNPVPTRGADYAHRITACSNGISVFSESKITNENVSKISFNSHLKSKNHTVLRDTFVCTDFSGRSQTVFTKRDRLAVLEMSTVHIFPYTSKEIPPQISTRGR